MIKAYLYKVVEKGFRIVARPFLREPLFNNSHYKTSALASPCLALLLRSRYKRLQASLVPQLFDHIRAKFGNDAKVAFIHLLGSASLYRDYNDIDVNVGLIEGTEEKVMSGKGEKDKVALTVMDEQGIPIKKEVEIHYFNANNIGKKDYVRFIFSKPVLFGRAPHLYPERTIDLNYAIREALEKFDNAPDDRKASHLLAAAYRHIYMAYSLKERKPPVWLLSSIRALYVMERKGHYDLTRLSKFRALIDKWLSERIWGGASAEAKPMFI